MNGDGMSACVRCGSCKAFCPTYREDAVEGMSARGRLMLLDGLSSGHLQPTPLLNDRIYSCTLCGICEKTCPAGLDIMGGIYGGRNRLRESDKKRKYLRFALGFSSKRPDFAFIAAKIFLPFLKKRVAFPFDMDLAERPLRKGRRIYKEDAVIFRNDKVTARVALFTGCAVNYLYPSLGRSLIETLLGAGYEVVLPPGEACCGAPLRAMGMEKEAVELSKKNLEVFRMLRVEAVLSLCPTCTLTLKRDYPKLIGQGIENAMDVSEFFAKKGLINLRPSNGAGKKVFYHDPCHLAFGLSIKDEPRKILRELGYKVMESREPSCCGFGISMTHKGLSAELLRERLEEARGAEEVVTSCPACMLQLGRGGKKIKHIIELIGGKS